MSQATKPAVQMQGKCICERHDGGWLVMTPDGAVRWVAAKATAERHCKSWFWIHNDTTKIGWGTIEWRKS
jgi:hypothetical protein